MSSYSLEGYLAALKIRGGKSLLLEGPTDMKIVARVLAEIDSEPGLYCRDVAVDPIDLIADEKIPRGHRNAVEFVYHYASNESLPLAALVDREFREFEVEQQPADHLRSHRSEGRLFWTRGHSIENYLFDARYIDAYLRMKIPEFVSNECLRSVRAELASILRIGAAASLAALKCQIIERCSGACRDNFWKSIPTGLSFDLDAYVGILLDRGVPDTTANDYRMRFAEYEKQLAVDSDEELNRWIVHGHLGWDFLWSGVAGILRAYGVARDVVNTVCRGFVDDKLRFTADMWARDVVRGSAESPRALWDWLCEAA
ncbi:hypothetical protein BH24GEM3_BH24GEM3_11620 [soil metagenome]